jgi:hypothetical protein
MLSLRVISQMMTNRLNIRLLLAKTKKVFACLMKNNCLVKIFHKLLKFKTTCNIYNLNQTRHNQYFKSFKIQKNSAYIIIWWFTYQTKTRNRQIKLFWENLSIFIELVSKKSNWMSRRTKAKNKKQNDGIVSWKSAFKTYKRIKARSQLLCYL